MIQFAVTLASLWLVISCRGSQELDGKLKPRPQTEARAPQSVIDQNVLKRDLLARLPADDNWMKLELMKVFPLDGQRGTIPIITPIMISSGSEGTVYITDAAGNQVIELSPDLEVLRKIPSQLFRPLNRPSWATPVDGTLYVLDLTGFNVFSAAGEWIGKFKDFVAAHSITLCRDDGMYVNPIFLYPPRGRAYPLVMQFDLSGRLLRSFGRAESNGIGAIDNRALLACDRHRLVAAFTYRSKIHVYALDGRKIRDIDVRYRPIRELERYNIGHQSTLQSSGIVHRVTLVAGVSMFEERIFVLLDLPRIEILEFDLQGRQVKHYHAGEGMGFVGPGGNGLVVRRQGRALIFYVLSGRGALFKLSSPVRSSPRALLRGRIGRGRPI